MEPQEFIALTGASYQDLADICDRPYATVAHWFCTGRHKRNPTPQDKRILKLVYESNCWEKYCGKVRNLAA